MKKLLLALFILSSFNSKGTIHTIGVWGGYYEFVPASITIQLGDTIEWEPYFGLLPMMLHTITSDNIPAGAVSFDQAWQMPADTFFQYVPQVAGLYQYVCTPHIPNGMIGEFTVTNGANTQTYVPDDNFEAYLEANGMGNGISNDDYVTTSSIDTVTYLGVYNQNISDLTGIENFTALEWLECQNNPISEIDISSNHNLIDLISGSFGSSNYHLISLNVKNGNNNNLKCDGITPLLCGAASYEINLHCIEVDDITWAYANWQSSIDTVHQYFSTNCTPPSGIQEHTINKELLKVTDLLGRETKQTNQPIFYIYDDGTVEKRIIIE
jgi:plastocyanin